jgi:hypothetical protein
MRGSVCYVLLLLWRLLGRERWVARLGARYLPPRACDYLLCVPCMQFTCIFVRVCACLCMVCVCLRVVFVLAYIFACLRVRTAVRCVCVCVCSVMLGRRPDPQTLARRVEVAQDRVKACKAAEADRVPIASAARTETVCYPRAAAVPLSFFLRRCATAVPLSCAAVLPLPRSPAPLCCRCPAFLCRCAAAVPLSRAAVLPLRRFPFSCAAVLPLRRFPFSCAAVLPLRRFPFSCAAVLPLSRFPFSCAAVLPPSPLCAPQDSRSFAEGGGRGCVGKQAFLHPLATLVR